MMRFLLLVALLPSLNTPEASISSSAVPPYGATFEVNQYETGHQQTPAIARAPDGSFVVAWDSDGQDGSLDGIYARRYDATGVPRGDEFRVNVNTRNRQIAPRVAMDDSGGFVVAWISNSQEALGIEIFARRYDASGAALGGEFRVDTTGHPTFSQFDVGMAPDGRFVVTWIDHFHILNTSVQQHTLNVQRYASDGSPLGSVLAVYQSTLIDVRTPTIAVDGNGNFVVAWFIGPSGIWARRYSADGVPRGGSFLVSPVDSTLDVDRPQIASNRDGGFVVSWETSAVADLSDTGVYARSYSAAGRALTAAQRLDAHLLRNPEVVASGSGFAVTAQSDAIYGQCVGVDGMPATSFRVDASSTLYTPLFASVGSDGSGHLAFAWQNLVNGVDRNVYVRLFGSC